MSQEARRVEMKNKLVMWSKGDKGQEAVISLNMWGKTHCLKHGKGFEFDSARDEGKVPSVEQREVGVEDDVSSIHILDTKNEGANCPQRHEQRGGKGGFC